MILPVNVGLTLCVICILKVFDLKKKTKIRIIYLKQVV